MTRRITGSDIEVTKEDQASINNFSKFYSRHKDIDQQLKDLKQKMEQRDDTMTELQLNDDSEPVRYRFGSCFLTLPTDKVKQFIERQLQQLKAKKAVLNKQNEDVVKKMKKLKATLYGKFGNSINLDQ